MPHAKHKTKDKYNRFNMYLSVDELKALSQKFSSAFNQKVSFTFLLNAYRRIRKIEKIMIGRFGEAIEDLLLLYTMRFVSGRTLRLNHAAHVEIGTLFGGSALVSSLAIANAGHTVTSFLIDPLDGFYKQSCDPISRLPVNEQNIHENYLLLGIDSEHVKILKGYSSDRNIINKAGQYAVLSLFIDGDHSYMGIYEDWINYSGMIVEDGYVLIDNYNDPVWPEVKVFVDGMVLKDKGWKPILALGQSILLQKLSVNETKPAASTYQQVDIDSVNNLLTYKNETIKHKDELITIRNEIIEDINSKLLKKERIISDKNDHISNLKSRLQNKTSVIESLNKSNQQLNESLSNQKETISNRNRSIARLKNQIDKPDRNQIKMDALRLDVKKLQNKINRKEKLLANCKEKIQKKDIVIANRKAGNLKLKDLIEQKMRTIKKKNQTISLLKEMIEKKTTTVTNKGRHIADLKEKLDNTHKSLKESLKVKANKIENQKKVILELKNRLERVQEAVLSRDRRIETLEEGFSHNHINPEDP